jgi:hypothetical protein
MIHEKDYADLRAARQSPERKRRTVKDMNEVREQVKAAKSKAEKERIAKAAGLFVRLPVSFHLTHSEISTCCKKVQAPSSILSSACVVEDFNHQDCALVSRSASLRKAHLCSFNRVLGQSPSVLELCPMRPADRRTEECKVCLFADVPGGYCF